MRCFSLLVIVFSLLTQVAPARADEVCFVAADLRDGRIVARRGKYCETRASPCSTFKIALSLMGFDRGILQDEDRPRWPFTPRPDGEGVDPQDQAPLTPKLWMSRSVVWYSQVLTPRLGLGAMQRYTDGFDYGNRDLSGDPGQGNGLTRAWLSSSLQISPREQLAFLRKLREGKLPVSPHAVEMTKRILYLGELEGGWKFYGKSGLGQERDAQGRLDPKRLLGWYVGWVERGDRAYAYALNIRKAEKIPPMKERQEMAASFLRQYKLLDSAP